MLNKNCECTKANRNKKKHIFFQLLHPTLDNQPNWVYLAAQKGFKWCSRVHNNLMEEFGKYKGNLRPSA